MIAATLIILVGSIYGFLAVVLVMTQTRLPKKAEKASWEHELLGER